MAYLYHSQSEARQRALFFKRNEMWVKRGDCRWILESEDVRNEGKRYPLHGKVRIGERSWVSVPAASILSDKKHELWQDLTKQQVFLQVDDPAFEIRMNTLPARLQLHPILETVAPYMEEVIFETVFHVKNRVLN